MGGKGLNRRVLYFVKRKLEKKKLTLLQLLQDPRRRVVPVFYQQTKNYFICCILWLQVLLFLCYCVFV